MMLWGRWLYQQVRLLIWLHGGLLYHECANTPGRCLQLFLHRRDEREGLIQEGRFSGYTLQKRESMSYTPPSVLVATRQGREQQPDIILSVVLLGRVSCYSGSKSRNYCKDVCRVCCLSTWSTTQFCGANFILQLLYRRYNMLLCYIWVSPAGLC